jgi:anti-sigma-K factor RskA
MNERDHRAYREDAGAYRCGALTETERQEFERHLATCAECREDVEWLRPAADVLPRSVEPVEPPPSLRAALMREVRADAAGPGLLERLLAAPRRVRPTVAWAGAAALLAIGVLAGLGVGELLSRDQVRTLNATAARGSASLTLSGNGEKGAILRVNGFRRLPRDRVYQAWVQRDKVLTPEPTFDVGPDGRGAVAVPDDLSNADAVLVTRERLGGARVPSGAPLLRVAL